MPEYSEGTLWSDLIDLSTAKRRSDNCQAFLDQLCERLDLDFASYATSNPITGVVQGYANYPDEWKIYYMRHNLHRIDPALHRTALSVAPIDWSSFKRDEKYEAVFYPARDFGLPNKGLTIPVRGPFGGRGLLSVTRSCTNKEWEKLVPEIIQELQLAAVHLHDAVVQTDALSNAIRRPALSTREKEVLQWVAVGKSQQDIGDILLISHRTVEVHLRSAREKLGALTTVQAVGRAVSLGVISAG